MKCPECGARLRTLDGEIIGYVEEDQIGARTTLYTEPNPSRIPVYREGLDGERIEGWALYDCAPFENEGEWFFWKTEPVNHDGPATLILKATQEKESR